MHPLGPGGPLWVSWAHQGSPRGRGDDGTDAPAQSPSRPRPRPEPRRPNVDPDAPAENTDGIEATGGKHAARDEARPFSSPPIASWTAKVRRAESMCRASTTAALGDDARTRAVLPGLQDAARVLDGLLARANAALDPLPGPGGRGACRRSPSRGPGGTRPGKPACPSRRCRRRRRSPYRWPGGQQRQRQPGKQRGAPRHVLGEQLLGEVVHPITSTVSRSDAAAISSACSIAAVSRPSPTGRCGRALRGGPSRRRERGHRRPTRPSARRSRRDRRRTPRPGRRRAIGVRAVNADGHLAAAVLAGAAAAQPRRGRRAWRRGRLRPRGPGSARRTGSPCLHQGALVEDGM